MFRRSGHRFADKNVRQSIVSAQDGFTLIEIVCVLAIVALLAAVILPAIPRGTSYARLEAFAIETATLLKQDRYAAMRRRTRVATEISASSRTFRSGFSGRAVRLPNDVAVEALLAQRCDQRAAGRTIDFFASGRSCGGTIELTRLGKGFQIRVNWLTGGVELVPIQL
ncbi:MAG TPA: prepilin-type N-terminal cleavage/methylation domain-containing protein [Xanthobacteraceae bacterium]|nr:prepilin-type N-terminal cleavage/methylation domain-containing protein [Xanthobacteraceae bacterium]